MSKQLDDAKAYYKSLMGLDAEKTAGCSKSHSVPAAKKPSAHQESPKSVTYEMDDKERAAVTKRNKELKERMKAAGVERLLDTAADAWRKGKPFRRGAAEAGMALGLNYRAPGFGSNRVKRFFERQKLKRYVDQNLYSSDREASNRARGIKMMLSADQLTGMRAAKKNLDKRVRGLVQDVTSGNATMPMVPKNALELAGRNLGARLQGRALAKQLAARTRTNRALAAGLGGGAVVGAADSLVDSNQRD